MVDGASQILAAAFLYGQDGAVEPWYHVIVQVEGDRIRVWVRERSVELVVEDSTIPPAYGQRLLLGTEASWQYSSAFLNLSIGAAEPYEAATPITLPFHTDFGASDQVVRNGVPLPAHLEAIHEGYWNPTGTDEEGASLGSLQFSYEPTGVRAGQVVGAPNDAFRLETDMAVGAGSEFVQFRATDTDNGYRVTLYSTRVHLKRIVNGASQVLAASSLYGADGSVESGYHVIVQVEGDRIRVWVRERSVELVVEDSTIPPAYGQRLLLGTEFSWQYSSAFLNLSIESLNQPSTLVAGGPYTAEEGASVAVTAAGSDPDGDVLPYAWDLDGEGTFETPGQSVVFSAASLDGPAARTIAVRATDPGGLSATDQATVEILNVAPTVGAITGAPQGPIQVGTSADASAAFTDPGMGDTHTSNWDWGDGTVEGGTITESGGSGGVSGSHSYAAPGVYTVSLTVTDDDGGSATNTVSALVFGYASGGQFVVGDQGKHGIGDSVTLWGSQWVKVNPLSTDFRGRIGVTENNAGVSVI